MRESGNLSAFAESLRKSALEDLTGAQAIRDELALLGQRALDELKKDHLSAEAFPEVRMMPKPAGSRPEIQGEPVAPLPAELDDSPDVPPDVSDEDDTPPSTGGKRLRRKPETLEKPAAAKVEPPAPPAGENGGSVPAATERAEAITPPKVVEAGAGPPLSAAEQLRREFAAGAHPPRSPESGAPVSPTRGAGHRVEPTQNAPGAAAEELRVEMAAPRPPVAGVQQPGGVIPMPASVDPAVSEAGVAGQPAAAAPGPETYTGRLYLMFPSTLGQDDIGSVWEILEAVAAGSIVENRLISSEAGIQFTLDLGSKLFTVEDMRKRMLGARLEALGLDRLRVDWPRVG